MTQYEMLQRTRSKVHVVEMPVESVVASARASFAAVIVGASLHCSFIALSFFKLTRRLHVAITCSGATCDKRPAVADVKTYSALGTLC